MTNLVSVHLQGTLDGLRHPENRYGANVNEDQGELFDDASVPVHEYQVSKQGRDSGGGGGGGGGRDPARGEERGEPTLWSRERWYSQPIPCVPLLEQIRIRGLNLSPLFVAKVPPRLLRAAGYSNTDLVLAGYPYVSAGIDQRESNGKGGGGLAINLSGRMQKQKQKEKEKQRGGGH